MVEVGTSGAHPDVHLPLHHRAQKFSSGTGSPGWSRKKGRKTVVVVLSLLVCVNWQQNIAHKHLPILLANWMVLMSWVQFAIILCYVLDRQFIGVIAKGKFFCATFVRVQLFSELVESMALGNSKDSGDFVSAEDVRWTKRLFFKISVAPPSVNVDRHGVWVPRDYVTLWNRADHYIFILSCVLLLSSFFLSSPNLSCRRVDDCHTCTHGVALVRI